MERLTYATKGRKHKYQPKRFGVEEKFRCLEKLGKLEDIENQPCIEGYKERTSKEVLDGLHRLCLKGTDMVYWGMVRHMVEQIEKNLDVLEIIKEKKVDVGYLLNEECESYGDYNSYQSCRQERILTEDEFSKVKEWLER